MTILAALALVIFGLAGLAALAVLAVAGRRAIAAWGELSRALESGDVRTARVTITGSRPQLRLVEGGVSRRPAVSLRGLRAAA